MNKVVLLVTIAFMAILSSCSGGENLVDVAVTTAVRPVIPAQASSCLARYQGKEAGTAPALDISAAYFTIPTITFTPLHKNRDVYIASISISLADPSTGSEITLDLGADALAALNSTWYATTSREAVISAGTTSLSTDCAIYVGGINKDAEGYTGTATVKIYGYEQNPNDINDATGFTIMSYVSFGR